MTYAEKRLILDLERRVKELEARIAVLEARPKRGRPPKNRDNGKTTND